MAQTDSFSEHYKAAGVDVTAGYRAVELMKRHVERTRTAGVLDSIGGFGGLFAPPVANMREPVLVSGTDGVGTKLRIAFLLDKHDTVGIDCVAMCVNDIVCVGASPLFFLDYLAVGKNIPEKIAQIVSGIADGCVQSGCALIGGETAEMPGFYSEDEYDMAGFAVGLVDKPAILNKADVAPGDVLIGLASSGVHSNGFSLVRKVLGNDTASMQAYSAELGMTVGEALLTPTRIYVQPVLALLGSSVPVKSIAHITGGGFFENIPRALPQDLGAVVDIKTLPVLPVFDVIARTGNIPQREMFNVFNMGIGMCVIVPPAHADSAVQILRGAGVCALPIGEVRAGQAGVTLAV
jgi:phosphoribosylaminoimidazole synthetase